MRVCMLRMRAKRACSPTPPGGRGCALRACEPPCDVCADGGGEAGVYAYLGGVGAACYGVRGGGREARVVGGYGDIGGVNLRQRTGSHLTGQEVGADKLVSGYRMILCTETCTCVMLRNGHHGNAAVLLMHSGVVVGTPGSIDFQLDCSLHACTSFLGESLFEAFAPKGK